MRAQLTNRMGVLARTILLTLLLLLTAEVEAGQRQKQQQKQWTTQLQQQPLQQQDQPQPRPQSRSRHSQGRNPIIVNPGRHVCMTQQQTQTPVKRMESYCKPVYKKHIHMCDRDGRYQLCTSFKVVYQLAYREAFHMRTQAQMVYSCCPGWTQRQSGDNGCLEPVCNCQNGGQCISPGVCHCPRGWTGSNCETDKDECRGHIHGCQQSCTNTPGSYSCSCEEGFKLSADGKNCKLCLTCIPEYDEVLSGYKVLSKRVGELEKEKADLQDNVNQIQKDYKREIERLQNDIATVSHSAATVAPPVAPPVKTPAETAASLKKDFRSNTQWKRMWDRIRSLSGQMALLEERLGECTCDNT